MTNRILILVALSCSTAIVVESCSQTSINNRPDKIFEEDDDRYWDKFEEGMENMGDKIDQEVEEAMKPIRDMDFRTKVQSGEDGTTVAEFGDDTFLVKNGVLYKCDGTISTDDGICDGSVKRFRARKKSDYCYFPITTQMNDYYCISPSGSSVSSGHSWGSKPYCKSDNGDAMLLSVDEYDDLCEKKSGLVKYMYFTNKQIGEHGSEVKCKGKRPTVCVLKSHGTNVMTSQIFY